MRIDKRRFEGIMLRKKGQILDKGKDSEVKIYKEKGRGTHRHMNWSRHRIKGEGGKTDG